MSVIYLFSETLNQKIKYDTETGIVTINEKLFTGKLMTYTREELDIIGEDKQTLDPNLHMVKRVFAGTIIKN